jgi:hypothetical protein
MSNLNGRWDLVVGPEKFPSWVEIQGAESRFVGRVGSARKIESLQIDGDSVTWQLPKQYENRSDDLVFKGRLEGDELVGTTLLDSGLQADWRGKRAPELPANPSPSWSEGRSLIGETLSNWSLRTPEWQSQWRIVDGMLYNDGVGSDLVSADKFGDFRLVAEYKYPPNSNSGIYLRGRYELQILDDFGHAPAVGTSGAIYGFIAPSKNAVKPADEWNIAEITLLGRFVTVVLNGETVVDGVEIPGITGGALDSDEGTPGPIFLQGDHGPVVFRRLEIQEPAS